LLDDDRKEDHGKEPQREYYRQAKLHHRSQMVIALAANNAIPARPKQKVPRRLADRRRTCLYAVLRKTSYTFVVHATGRRF
jgi:hypothetical protein